MSYFDLGSFHRKFTTESPESQIWLDRGFSWLFGFNHEEAIVCFEKSLASDKTCVMAYWGIAHAIGPNYNKVWEFFTYKEKIKSRLLFSILDKLLFDEIREKDNLVYTISAGKNYDQKIPIELMSFYTYFNSDPKNVDKIKDKIDLVINRIKTKDFDLQIFKDQKLALKNNYQSYLRSNGFWLNVLTDARQHNLSIERITNTNAMLKSISLNDIARLANYYFDENYTRSVMLLAE